MLDSGMTEIEGTSAMTFELLPELLKQMSDPAFFDHDTNEDIQVIQTHISYVVLTGPFAYKIKKDVNLGFLDFSTPARRLHFCREELRLNRAFSPDLYLDVVAFRIDDKGHWHWTDDLAEADEYAVKMVEFDQDAMMSHLFDAGELTHQDMRKLGERIARLHYGAETDDEIAAFGGLEGFRQVADDNHRDTERFVGQLTDESMWYETRDFTRNFLREHGDWIIARQKQGQVRACHGDLHLHNICLLEDGAHLFDCIEFNPQFRNIDTLYDFAFLMVDVLYRGRRGHANELLNAYLEFSDDYLGARLLPLYLSVRASIRAKVLSLESLDVHHDSRERQLLERQARSYYRLAWQMTRPQRGDVWVVSGISGSGKSTVARHLARRLSAVHIRTDAVRKHLGKIPLHQPGGEDLYTDEMTVRTYHHLCMLAATLSRSGLNVVLDGKFDQLELRNRVRRSTSQHDVIFVECYAPEQVLLHRLANRHDDISDAGPRMVMEQKKVFEGFTALESETLVRLDTDGDWQSELEREMRRFGVQHSQPALAD
jgi:aminoglycoside phosphotransferase family enzyme/adenylate kinase family enzyme